MPSSIPPPNLKVRRGKVFITVADMHLVVLLHCRRIADICVVLNRGTGGMAIRAGSMKLLVGYPGDERHLAVPNLAESAVAFGKSGGVIENGTANHAVAPGFQGQKPKLNSSLCGGRLTQTRYCLFDVSFCKQQLAIAASFRHSMADASAECRIYGMDSGGQRSYRNA